MYNQSSPDLCNQCGACCDGTFFEEALIRPSDLNPVIEQLDLLHKGDKIKIRQPCSCHVNNRCTIYEHRPSGCRDYECKLLRECKEGKIAEDDALRVIDQLKSALEELNGILEKATIPEQQGGILKRMQALERESLAIMSLSEYRKKYGPLLIKYRLLQELFTERFGIGFKKKSLSS